MNGLSVGDLSGGYAVQKKHAIPVPLIAAGISALGGVASSLIGGNASEKAAKRAERQLQGDRARNNAWYLKNYNESVLDKSSGQNILRIARDAAQENWKKAQGAAAVGGGTDAATALAKESGNRMIGNAAANIAAQDSLRKDNIDAQYRQREAQLSQQQMQIDQQKAANAAQAAANMSNALIGGAAQMVGGLGSGGSSSTPVTRGAQTNNGTTNVNLDNMFDNFNYQDFLKKSGQSPLRSILKTTDPAEFFEKNYNLTYGAPL